MLSRLRPNITLKFVLYLIFFSVIPLLVVGMVSSATASNQLRAEINRSTQQIVHDQLDYLELQQSQIESLLVNLSGVETIRNALRTDTDSRDDYTRLSTQAQIGYILNGYINIEGLVSIDLFTMNDTHYTVGDTLVTDAIRVDVKDRIFETALANDGTITWIGIDENVNSDSEFSVVITAASALYEFNRDTLERMPVALLMVNFDPADLYQHFSQVNLSESGYLVVVDSRGRFVYHPDLTRIGTAASDTLRDHIRDLEPAPLNTLNVDTIDGQDMVINTAYSDTSGWSVISLVPLASIAARTNEIWNSTLFVLGASFLVMGAAGFIYNQQVVTPIRAVIHRFQRIEHNPEQPLQRLPPRGQDEIGQLIQWFNLFMDHLESRHQAQAERERLIADLQTANRRAEESTRLKSEFLATMSHELRTPLNAIIGYSQLQVAGMAGQLSPDQHQLQERVLINAQHLLGLINEVLDLSKIESGRLELIERPFDVRALASEIVQQNSVLAEDKGLAFRAEIDEQLPEQLIGDSGRIKQIIINLISNAIKFTDQGEVSLHMRVLSDEQWSICVRDTGIGIPSHAQQTIFDEFRQAEQGYHRGGTGLGLAIVRKLALEMNGSIRLQSASGQGSVFTVTLPARIPEITVRKEGVI